MLENSEEFSKGDLRRYQSALCYVLSAYPTGHSYEVFLENPSDMFTLLKLFISQHTDFRIPGCINFRARQQVVDNGEFKIEEPGAMFVIEGILNGIYIHIDPNPEETHAAILQPTSFERNMSFPGIILPVERKHHPIYDELEGKEWYNGEPVVALERLGTKYECPTPPGEVSRSREEQISELERLHKLLAENINGTIKDIHIPEIQTKGKEVRIEVFNSGDKNLENEVLRIIGERIKIPRTVKEQGRTRFSTTYKITYELP